MTCSQIAHRVDWHALLDDLAFLDVTGDELAACTGLCVGLLQQVATGKSRPAPVAAEKLACLWCVLTGKAAEFLPHTGDAGGAPRPEVPGIDCNAAQVQSLAQQEATARAWALMQRTGIS